MMTCTLTLLIATALGVSITSAIADTVPKLNVEPSCRAAAKMGDSMDATLQGCMREEQTARAKLEKDWTQFSPSSRASCVALINQTGSQASYVEVLTCLESAREADRLRKAGEGRGN